jgi:hypothetical protein
MSHFTVLVIGRNPEEQLAPYHEFESTGRDDEYVKDVDITETARAAFAEATACRYRDPGGALHEPYEARFYRDPTPEEVESLGARGLFVRSAIGAVSKDWGDGQGVRDKVHFLPDGWSEVRVPLAEVESFAEFVDDEYGARPVPFGREPDLADVHKYGYALLDADGAVLKVVDRTNPRKKWDWYQLGGRWTGYFKLKPVELRKRPVVVVGTPGIMTAQAEEGRADQALLCDIDIAGMRAEAAARAAEEFDEVAPAFAGKTIPSWTEIRGRYSAAEIDAARAEHNNDPVRLAMVALDWGLVFVGDLRERFCGGDRDKFVGRARDGALVPFAFLKEGAWVERGKMIGFGQAVGEQNVDEWHSLFARLLDDLPPDTLLSLYDCHI